MEAVQADVRKNNNLQVRCRDSPLSLRLCLSDCRLSLLDDY